MSHDALSGQQFPEIRPYFTKGGQGKFFKDPKPVDEHRYQKGYTPERMREVQSWPIEVDPGSSRGTFAGQAGAHRIWQTIARSKTPASDFPPDDDKYNLHIKPGASLNTASGTYEDTGHWSRGEINLDRGSGPYDRPRVDREVEERSGFTLMHELGHYRSKKVERTPHSYYSTPAARGREEAFADENAMERFRPDPRDVRRGWGGDPAPSYESLAAHYGIGGRKSHAAYLKARKTPIVRDRRIRQQAADNANASFQDNLFDDYKRSRG